MMDLKNIDLLSLQTSHMKQDPTTRAMCAALTPVFRELANEVKLCLIYARVNELDDVALDELAWQMHIDWYDPKADIEIKREIIKTSDEVHATKGTPYAVEKVIQAYFGDASLKEWFEYGGQPYMFRVETSNPSVTSELADQFIAVLDSVKNKRSHLEQILVLLSGELNNYFGGAVHIGDNLTIRQVI